MERRDFFKGMAGTAIGMGGFVNSSALLPVSAQVTGPESAQIGEIYQLQANYQRAKTTQDINLMMSLWDGRWLFWNLNAGSARPLSADHYYFP